MSFRRMRHVKARELQGIELALDASASSTMYDATSGGSLVADGGLVARLNDISGKGNNATQATSAARPTRKQATWNGLDVLRFSGSNQMSNGYASSADPTTFVFAGVKRATQTGFRGLMSNGIGGAMLLLRQGTSPNIGSYRSDEMASTANPGVDAGFVVSQESTSTQTNWRFNGSSAGQVSGNAIGQTAHIGGQAGSQESKVDLFEACAWSVSLTVYARQRFDLSRCRKWRIAS